MDLEELTKKVEEHEQKLTKLYEKVFTVPPQDISSSPETPIKKFAQDCGITEEQLMHVFDFGPDNFIVIADIDSNKESEKQYKYTLMILAASSYIFGRDTMKSSELLLKLEDQGVGSLQHLAKNLSKHPSEILLKGECRTSFEYKLTVPGKKKALDMIKAIYKSANPDT